MGTQKDVKDSSGTGSILHQKETLWTGSLDEEGLMKVFKYRISE